MRAAWAAIAATFFLFGHARADITVNPGSSNPVYPAMTDPWMVVDLDLEGNILTVDAASTVMISDTLFVGGRVVLESGATLTSAETALFDDAALTSPSPGAFIVTASTFEAGFFTSVTDTSLYLAIDDGGLMTTSSSSVIGDNSTIVIGMDDGGEFRSNADFTFGGNNSSFTLGPSIADPADDAGDFDGTEAASNAANTLLVIDEKAKNADAAMAAADEFTGITTTPDPGRGNDIIFFIDGNATFAGDSSDTLVYLGPNSSFEVTGSASFAGGSSTADFLGIDTTFTVGSDWSVTRGSSSTATTLFTGSMLDIGNDWLLGGNLGSSVSTLDNSTVMVGRHFDNRLGDASAGEINFDMVNFTTGGDFLVGAGEDSAFSTTVNDSTITSSSNFQSVVGGSSVQSLVVTNSTLNLSGNFLFDTGGALGQSSATSSMDTVNITANDFTNRVNSDTSSMAISYDAVDFDLGGNFLVEGPTFDSDVTILMIDTTGEIDGNFSIDGASGVDSSTTVVVSNFDVTIGGNLSFNMAAQNGSKSQLAIAGFTPDVTGNVEFDVARLPGSTMTSFNAAVDLQSGGDVTFTPNTFGEITGSMDVGGSIVNSGNMIFNIEAGDTVSANLVTLAALATSDGVLNISGTSGSRGALSVPDLQEGPGTGSVVFDGGIFRTTVDNANLFASFEVDDITLAAGGGFIDTNGFDLDSAYGFSGPGALNKLGEGILTLTGDNMHTGGTTVEAGTLFAGTMNAFPQNTPYTVNGGTLDLNDFDLTASSFGGAGGITDLGSATLTVDQIANTSYAGDIVGSGELMKMGAGSLTLSGTNTYTGDTIIDGGAFLVIGSVASPNTFVNSGGLLGGTGQIAGNVFNTGVVSPGLSPGTLEVGGDYSQDSSAMLRIEIASQTRFDRLIIDGSASLDGTLQVIANTGYSPQMGDEFTFLTAAGGRTGVFSTLDQSQSPVMFEIRYGNDDVTLFLRETNFAQFFGSGLTTNQRAVARVLDASSGDPRQGAVVNFLLSQSLLDLPSNLDRLAPEELAAMAEILLATSESQGQNVVRRLRNARDGLGGTASFSMSDSAGPIRLDDRAPWLTREVPVGMMVSGSDAKSPVFTPLGKGVWVDGGGEFIDIESDGNGSGYQFNTGAFTLGIDREIADGWIMGFAGSYAGTDADLVAGGALDVSGVRGMLYSSWFSGGVYLDAVVGFGYHEFNIDRSALGGVASGETEGVSFDALLSGGFDIPCGEHFTFGPTASLGYAGADIQGYRESGSLAPLLINPDYGDSFRSRLGVRFAGDKTVNGIHVTGEVRAQWQHEYLDDNGAIVGAFANGAGGPFTVFSPSLGRDSAILGAGLTAEFSPDLSGYIGYEAELGRNNFDRHTVQLGVEIKY